MYTVYWMQDREPKARQFGSDELVPALAFTEEKRKEGHRFVTMAGENPNMVGKLGVDVTGPEYDWKKRRR